MTERLHFDFSFSCIGEGNGNPLQCSRLENPRDGGAWWAAVYGVAQSWTRVKRLSSSSSSSIDLGDNVYPLTWALFTCLASWLEPKQSIHLAQAAVATKDLRFPPLPAPTS